MAGLGLKEDLIEMEGLDLGADRRPRPYLDTSRAPAVIGHFHHTRDASMGHDHRHVPVHAGRIAPSGDALVDAWIDALQDGDDAAARRAQQTLANSFDSRQWPDGSPLMPLRDGAAGPGTAATGRRDAPESGDVGEFALTHLAPHAQHQAEPQQAMER